MIIIISIPNNENNNKKNNKNNSNNNIMDKYMQIMTQM